MQIFQIGPRGDDDEYSRRERSSSKLKLLKDTVEAIREKKYVKGRFLNFFLFVKYY